MSLSYIYVFFVVPVFFLKKISFGLVYMLRQSLYPVEKFASGVVRSKYRVFFNFFNLILSIAPKCVKDIIIEKNEIEIHIDKKYINEFMKVVKDHS